MLPPTCVDAWMNHSRANAGSRKSGPVRIAVTAPFCWAGDRVVGRDGASEPPLQEQPARDNRADQAADDSVRAKKNRPLKAGGLSVAWGQAVWTFLARAPF